MEGADGVQLGFNSWRNPIFYPVYLPQTYKQSKDASVTIELGTKLHDM